MREVLKVKSVWERKNGVYFDSRKVLILFLIFPGCATMVNKGKTKLVVTTNPDSCKIYFNNKYLGKSPLRTKIEYKDYNREKNILLIEKEGYLPEKLLFYKRFEAGYILADFLLSSLIGGSLGALIGASMAPGSPSTGNSWLDVVNSLGILLEYMEKGMLIGFSTFFIFSLITDYQTDSFYFLYPDSVNVNLKRAGKE